MVCVIIAAGMLYYGGPLTARYRWMQVVENTPPGELPVLMESIARREASTPLLPRDESTSCAAGLAELLAMRTGDFRAPARHLAAQLIEEVVEWPLDGAATDVAQVLAHCETVLRNDPGPASLYDVAPAASGSADLTPLSALPTRTGDRSNDPLADWEVSPLPGGGLPVEPHSEPAPPKAPFKVTVDSIVSESVPPRPSRESEPPRELYEPLAIPLRLAPLLTGDGNDDSPTRSNRPAKISAQADYQPEKLQDLELMRDLHDLQKSTRAEVDPGPIDLPAIAIDRQARLAVVQPRQDNIRPAIHAQPQIVHDIAAKVMHVDGRVDVTRGGGSGGGLGLAIVRFAIEHRAREVGVLDPI